MVDPVVAERLLEGVGDVFLPDDLGEGLGSVAAVQREGRHAYDDIGPHRQPRRGKQAPPTHPPELTYPCCLPALGGFSEMAPREGLHPAYRMPETTRARGRAGGGRGGTGSQPLPRVM
ncbi:hypothetical protein GCM10010420_01490 [Streptomyces glaucosporus]|uniref:Uncharacterized protein n=1 Tax=Streptomyces glaucosporus TaxID=284044 RepID=A0ABN3HLB6_9ACTN